MLKVTLNWLRYLLNNVKANNLSPGLKIKKAWSKKPCLSSKNLSPLFFYLILVTVVFRFKRTINSYADVFRLVLV